MQNHEERRIVLWVQTQLKISEVDYSSFPGLVTYIFLMKSLFY